MRVITTTCSSNYIHRATSAMETHREHNKDYAYHIVLCERPDVLKKLPCPSWLKMSTMYDIGIPDPERLAYVYDVLEVNTAVKPFVFRELFATGAKSVTYLDPDTRTYAKHYDVDSYGSDAVVTPHLIDDRYDGMFPDMLQNLKCGQMNFGYLSLRNTPNACGFLAWWADVLLTRCVKDFSNGVFVDQSWGQAIFSLMDKVHVERTPGTHCAYWNVRKDDLVLLKDKPVFRGHPLVMWHFSGFDPYNPVKLSCHSERFNPIPAGSAMAKLAADYAKDVQGREKAWPARHLPYSFAKYEDGKPIQQAERRAVLADPWARSETLFKRPPQVIEGPGGFREAYVRRTWQVLGMAGPNGAPAPIAIYGAGKHTDWLQHCVAKCDVGPKVMAILDDGPTRKSVHFGIERTSRPEEHAARPRFGAVVLSTDVPANAARMCARVRSVFGKSVKVFNLYEGCPPGQYV